MPCKVLMNDHFRPLALLPVLVTAVALAISMFCLFAGYKPGFMDDYAVLTLNVSRIGENTIRDLDAKIMGFHIDLKRSLPTRVVTPTMSRPQPTTFVTIAPRFNVGSEIASAGSDLTSKAASVGSDIHSAATSVDSAVHSDASSIESAAASEITSAVANLDVEIVALVNSAYHDIITDLNLTDFYTINIRTSCSGIYRYHNGTNITVGDIDASAPTRNGSASAQAHMLVTECEAHDSLDPLDLLKLLYAIGIALTALALFLNVASVFRCMRFDHLEAKNAVITLPALFVLAMASAVTEGVATGASKLIDFLGEDMGVAAYVGSKFLTLSWAAVILLFVSVMLWAILGVVHKRLMRREEKGFGEK